MCGALDAVFQWILCYLGHTVQFHKLQLQRTPMANSRNVCHSRCLLLRAIEEKLMLWTYEHIETDKMAAFNMNSIVEGQH